MRTITSAFPWTQVKWRSKEEQRVYILDLTLKILVGLISAQRAASPFIDTIPFVASKAIPFLGWFLVIPIWTTVKNLRLETLRLPRVALLGMLLFHLSFLAYTVWSWVG